MGLWMFSQKYHTEGCGRFLGDSHTVTSIRNNDGLKTSRYSIKAVLERRGVTASGRRVGGIMRERGTWARTRADDPNRTGCGLANRGIVGHSVGRARDAGLVLAAFCTLDFLLAASRCSTPAGAASSTTRGSTSRSTCSTSKDHCHAGATPTTTPWPSRRTGC